VCSECDDGLKKRGHVLGAPVGCHAGWSERGFVSLGFFGSLGIFGGQLGSLGECPVA